jgi:hypothetical protein
VCDQCATLDPRRTFGPCGSANLSALRSVAISPVIAGRPFRKGTHDRSPMNSWERGVPVSKRVDGSVMPYLDGQGQVIGQRDWSDTYRRKFEAEGLA